MSATMIVSWVWDLSSSCNDSLQLSTAPLRWCSMTLAQVPNQTWPLKTNSTFDSSWSSCPWLPMLRPPFDADFASDGLRISHPRRWVSRRRARQSPWGSLRWPSMPVCCCCSRHSSRRSCRLGRLLCDFSAMLGGCRICVSTRLQRCCSLTFSQMRRLCGSQRFSMFFDSFRYFSIFTGYCCGVWKLGSPQHEDYMIPPDPEPLESLEDETPVESLGRLKSQVVSRDQTPVGWWYGTILHSTYIYI